LPSSVTSRTKFLPEIPINTARSKPGQGATFIVTLPVRQPNAKPETEVQR
jgi:hypothetical protein